MVQVFQMNREAIRALAEDARKREESRGQNYDNDLPWYDWRQGENLIRLCPPYSQKGMYLKYVGYHYRIDEKGNKGRCLLLTHGDIPNIQCPFCNKLDAVKQQYPHFNVGFYAPRRKAYGWVIDQKDPQKGPQIANFPGGVADWVTIQLDNYEYDIANITSGVDICITKSGSSKDWKSIRYDKTLTPSRSPLAPNDQILADWISKMKDLDMIFKVPEKEDMDALVGTAEEFGQYLIRKAEDELIKQRSQSGTVGFPYQMPPPAPVQSGGYPVGPSQTQVDPYRTQVVASPVGQQIPPAMQFEQYNLGSGTAQAASVPPPPVPSAVPPPQPIEASPVASPVGQPLQAQVSPPAVTGAPDCFGGAVAHADGTTGYQGHIEKCQACPKEFDCTNAMATAKTTQATT